MDTETYDRRVSQLLRQARYAEVKSWSAEMLASDPDYAHAILHQGIARFELGDPAGFDWMKQALARNPENDHYYFVLALAYGRDRQYDEALSYISTAITLAPKAERYYTLKGSMLSAADRNAEALPFIEEAIRLNPKEAKPYIDKAFALVQLKQLDEVESLIQTAMAIQPDASFVKYTSGGIFYDLRRFKESIAMLEDHFVLSPGDPWAPYTHLMAHQTRFTSLLFRREVVKTMNTLTIVAGCLALVVQLAGLFLPISTWISLLVLNVAYAGVLHQLVRGFLSLFLLLRLEPRFRRMREEKAKREMQLLRAGVLLTLAAFVADLAMRHAWSHLGFVLVLNALVFTVLIRHRKLLLKKEQRIGLTYGCVAVAIAGVALGFGLFPASGLLVVCMACTLVVLRPFFIQVSKELFGFNEQRERKFSY